MVALGELISPAKVRKAGANEYPLLSMTMHNGLVLQSERFDKRIASRDTSTYKVIERGQLVVGFPIDEGVLDFQEVCDEGIVSPAYQVWEIQETDAVDSSYLGKYLKSPKALSYYVSKLQGSTARRRSLPQSIFLDMHVPLPPMAEQRRIATMLDATTTINRKHKETIDLVVALGDSVFNNRFRHNYPKSKLADLGSIHTGKTPPTSEPCLFGGNTPFVTPGDLDSGKQAARTISPAGLPYCRTVRAGSTLVCCIGATIGKSDIATSQSAFNQQLNAIEWGEKIDDIFGLFAIRSIKQQIVSRGASTTMPILSKKKFSTLEIKVPPIENQQQFASIIRKIWAHESSLTQSMRMVSELAETLQYRAFRGDL